jgi:ketosteroid isomerase-like protein
MSAANIAAIREGFEAFNSGDVARILAFTDPGFETEVPPELSAEPDTYRGHEGVRRYFESFAEAMNEVHFEPEQFWTAGDLVVVTAVLTAKGKRTGIPVEQRIAQVWTLRDGRALRAETYAELSEALQAAGLSAEDARATG